MKKLILFISFITTAINLQAQSNVITTGVPFLTIAADARSAGMADIGVATSADVFSQQWNASKYAFATDQYGISVSYTPYLTSLANDIALSQITFYDKINERSAFGVGMRYFGLGEIELRQFATDEPRIVSPNEMAIDGSYSLKLSEKFSMGISGRFIRSNLKAAYDAGDSTAASTFSVDISGFYQSEETAYNSFNGRWRGGFNLQNLGPKINYDNTEQYANFLPSNLKLGGGFDFILDEYNKVSTNIEFNKLLVPTPQDFNDDGVINGDDQAEYNNIGWTSGIFKSFGDAPGGFKEELQEVTYALGAEYMYQDSFALRLGYFNENENKGSRKYFSLGAGFKYTSVKIDVSYLFSASQVRNPLENTLRFSLTFNFGDEYEQF
jgi:hypothetical protein